MRAAEYPISAHVRKVIVQNRWRLDPTQDLVCICLGESFCNQRNNVGIDDLSLDLQLKVLKRLQNKFLYGPKGLS